MAKAEETKSEQDEPLTEAQRLDLIEKSVRANKMFLIVVCLLLTMGLAIALTVAIVRHGSADAEILTASNMLAVQEKLNAAEQQLLLQQQQIEKLSSQEAAAAPPQGNSEATTKALIDQEQRFQIFLKTLKQGMKDLANMLPGSRTWLDLYNESLNKLIEDGNKRIQGLEASLDAQKPQAAVTP